MSEQQLSSQSPGTGSRGNVFVITGPSGVGKGTVCAFLAGRFTPYMKLSISATSRPQRSGEQEGVSYFFKTRAGFEAMIEKNELLEWAEYNGHYYGTPRTYVEKQIARNFGVLLEIDTQGALQVKQRFPMACLIFVEPPSLEALESRLTLRGANTEADIQQRLAIAQGELALKDQFDYVVVNDHLPVCQNRIVQIIELWQQDK